MSEAKRRRALNFDLDTEALKTNYTKGDRHNAYYDVRRYLEKNGFEHRQGSGYISEKAMTNTEMQNICKNMNSEFPWIGSCLNKFDVTNIGKQHDMLYCFKDNSNSGRSSTLDIPLKIDEQDNGISYGHSPRR